MITLNHIYKITLHLVLAVLLTACSNIAEDERIIYVGPQPSPVDPVDTTETYRQNVLIEDFTGQRCSNCPTAASIIDQLLEAYGDSIIVPVAIHSGSFGVAEPKGLMTTIASNYFPTGHGQPVGRINRGEAVDEYTSWGALVTKEMAKTAALKLAITTDYAVTSGSLVIKATATASKDITAKYQLWLIEDGITATQIMPDGSYNYSYVHNHVFRDAINGIWGEDVTITGNRTDTNLPEHTYTLSTNYAAENCSVVAFIYNDDGVLQVTKTKIIQ